MRTNLSSCLGLIHNGQNHSTNRLLVLVPHKGTHGTMCLMKQLRMFRPKITKMRAIKKAMPLIPNSPGGAEGASAQMPRRCAARPRPHSHGQAWLAETRMQNELDPPTQKGGGHASTGVLPLDTSGPIVKPGGLQSIQDIIAKNFCRQASLVLWYNDRSDIPCPST